MSMAIRIYLLLSIIFFVKFGYTQDPLKNPIIPLTPNAASQEVKVDLNGAVAPGHVFEKDYRLTSLEELKDVLGILKSSNEKD